MNEFRRRRLQILECEFDTLLLLYLRSKQRGRRYSRRCWVTRFLEDRSVTGIMQSLIPRLSDEEYRRFLRVTREQFDYIHDRIVNDIRKKHTFFRESISTRERLALTLRFLASGHSFRDLSYQFRMGESTISGIVKEVCQSIWVRLQPDYMPTGTKETWLEKAKKFEELWNFPNCLGAVDGKHVWIVKPLNSGSEYYCYKQKFSIVLMAAADAQYKFIFVDVGIQGRFSDGYSWARTAFAVSLRDGKLDLPEPRQISTNLPPLPYVLVGDAAFPIQEHLMRPYPGKYTKNTMEPRIFNYRLSRARQCIECAFGILSARFRVYSRPLYVRVQMVNDIVKATCVLHNYLRGNLTYEEDVAALDASDFEEPTGQFTALPRMKTRSPKAAFQIREKFSAYFNSAEGSVPWQTQAALRGKY